MSIAFDATAQGKSSVGSFTLTYSHTCSGANRVLIVGVDASDNTDSVTGVTYNSVAMTKIGSAVTAGGGSKQSLWYLLAPATGAHDIVITRNANNQVIYGASISLTGVTQSAQPDSNAATPSSGSTTSRTATATVTRNNCYAVAVGYSDNGNLAAGTNSTLRGTVQDGAFGIFDSSDYGLIAAGSFAMTITGTSGGQAISMGVFHPIDISKSVTDSVTCTDADVGVVEGWNVEVSDSVKMHENMEINHPNEDWNNPSKSSDAGWTNVDKS